MDVDRVCCRLAAFLFAVGEALAVPGNVVIRLGVDLGARWLVWTGYALAWPDRALGRLAWRWFGDVL